MNILNVYYSQTGNTEKIAQSIAEAAASLGHQVKTIRAVHGLDLDFFIYDFIFVGSGVYQWLPGKPLLDILRGHRQKYADAGMIRPCAPRLPDKKVVVYCTYAGVHTGISEAVPAVKFSGQLFDHLGFTIIDEWYFVGGFPAADFQHHNTGGRLGNIAGRPDARDLQEVAERVKAILSV